MPMRTVGAAAGAASVMAAASPPLDTLLTALQDDDETARTEAWRAMGGAGAEAVAPLAKLMLHADPEVARAAKRGLWQLVRHVGRPGAASEQQAVEAALLTLLSADTPEPVRREAVWMLSEIGDDASVAPLATLLSEAVLREDARLALERIPGKASRAALEEALQAAPREFQPHLAVSLRKRGKPVRGIVDDRLTPSRATAVQSEPVEGGAA